MKTLYGLIFISLVGISLYFINPFPLPSNSGAESRWYDQSMVDRGSTLFKQNCSSCHGVNAEAALDWKKINSNGKYPPPPLNGTAHAWHHSIETLKATIQEGGINIGGSMPAFKSKLSDEDQDAVIAYFQSKWPDDIYQKWSGRYQTSDIPLIESTAKLSTDTQAAENKMTSLLRLRLGNKEISDPVSTPVEGIYQTQFGNEYAYLTQDGRYVFIGNLIDLETGINLTVIAKGKTAIAELNRVALEDKVIFPARGVEKAVLNVFTDTTCPYCRKFHEEVGKLQEAGISIHYLPYPRGGKQGPGYRSLKQVWCAKDKLKAMGIAKDLDTGDLPAGDCEKGKFVDEGYALGNRVGITGTPSLFKSTGEKIQGYVPYQQLIPRVLSN
jgi:protein-disulfide isomerase/mono/diheme cytochrome c family protein